MATKKKAQVGDIVLVTKNSNSHNYTIGERYRITKSKSNGSGMLYEAANIDTGWIGNWLRGSDCEVVTALTIEDFEKKLADLLSEVQETQSVIDWMKETGAAEYNETEHKVWEVLTVVENDSMSKLDKVKAIAALVK